MKNQRTILLAVGLLWAAAAGGASPETNDVHQQALDVLRKAMDTLEPKYKTPPPAKGRPGREPTFAEAEQLFLQGKMSARDYQKYLEEHKVDPAKPTNTDPQSRAVEVLRNEISKAEAGGSKPEAPSAQPGETPTAKLPGALAEPPPGPEQSKLSEVEQKMDELLRLKAAREAAVATNSVSATTTNLPAPPTPKTKRQRLDELLKLFIDGKIPEAQYWEKRGKLLDEPD